MKSFQAVIIAALAFSTAAINEPVASPTAAIERKLAEYERQLRPDVTEALTPDVPQLTGRWWPSYYRVDSVDLRPTGGVMAARSPGLAVFLHNILCTSGGVDNYFDRLGAFHTACLPRHHEGCRVQHCGCRLENVHHRGGRPVAQCAIA
eukprot:scaffold30997_cov126-Skeletonema_menzelii.AAC.1